MHKMYQVMRNEYIRLYRRGELIFLTTDLYEGWDGRVKRVDRQEKGVVTLGKIKKIMRRISVYNIRW
jgi:hypothetical protein